jgi:UDP-arabinose 4-epimerase
LKVLVTGGAGFIGSATCACLAHAGFHQIVFDNLSTGHTDNVRWGPLEVGDVCDRSRVSAVLSLHRPNAIIHFAASAYVGESTVDPEKYFRNNVNGMLNLLSAARAAGVKFIVFSSSCATYGTPPQLPITEDSPQVPTNPYGRTKLAGEWMLRDFASAYGLRFVALRYFNAAGADTENGLTERHDPETHAIPRILMAASRRIPHFEIFGNDHSTPDGTCIRDYVHVRDLAEAHVSALRHLLGGGQSLALNLGTGRGTSINEILGEVEEVFGVTVPTLVKPRREGDPAALVADASQARAILGFDPVRSNLKTILTSAGPSFGL